MKFSQKENLKILSNAPLMQGHRDSSVSPCSLPEITEHRIFYILFYCEQISLKGIKFCT